jgi:type II secretory pathway pseudopilin PulG
MVSHQLSRRGFTLIEVCCILVLLSILVALAVPAFFRADRGVVERSAATCLKTLATAEADFRANDRDWNHVNDYWTGDVKGLYTMTAAAVRGNAGTTTTDPSIKLIELSVASADADGETVPAGGENAPLASFAVPSAKSGYWFAAMDFDRSVGPGTPKSHYRQDTGGEPPMGKCHHLLRFGFLAFPDSPSSGKYLYMINEKNVVYRRELSDRVRPSTATPPGLGGPLAPFLAWPMESERKASWVSLD